MSASIELLFAPAKNGNPFHIAKMKLIAGLARLPVPHIDVVPTPEQIESIGDYVAGVARLTDVLMRAVGTELRSNATVPIQLDNFQTPCSDAVSGMALFDIQVSADELRAEELALGHVDER